MNRSYFFTLLILAMPYAMLHASYEELTTKETLSSLQKSHKQNLVNTVMAIEMLNVINRSEVLYMNHHTCLYYCCWSCCMPRPQNKLREMISFNADLNSKIDTLIKSSSEIQRD